MSIIDRYAAAERLLKGMESGTTAAAEQELREIREWLLKGITK